MSIEVEKNMERIGTREKYLNGQLSDFIHQYGQMQEQLKQVEDKYRESSGKPITSRHGTSCFYFTFICRGDRGAKPTAQSNQ